MWTERRSNLTALKRSHEDHRQPFERDLTRVIHSPAFRKLQRKTQILGTDEGDFHRTRLTHSLEVASIAKSMVRNLQKRSPSPTDLPCDDLISAISLLHDIGHPPFGHGGEVALNFMMRQNGGFESNGQTLRLIAKNDMSYGDCGLNLTRRTLLGILKYPVSYSKLNKALAEPDESKPLKVNDWLPPKCYFDSEQDVIDWLLAPLCQADRDLFQAQLSPTPNSRHKRTKYKSFDCSIMNISDDIAYGVHDFEDAIQLKLIARENIDTKNFKMVYEEANQFEQLPPYSIMSDGLFNQSLRIRKSMIGELVNFFIVSTDIKVTEAHQNFESPLLRYNTILNPQAKQLLSLLKKLIYDLVIDSLEARTIEFGGQTVILRLFKAIRSNPTSLLDLDNRQKYQEAGSEDDAMRVLCDYIATMSDEYAYRMHERLFGFNTRTVFERL